MSRFIRTKDGKIFDLQAVNHSIRHAKIRKVNNGDIEIIKQADTIEDLVFKGDLIKSLYDGIYYYVEKVDDDWIYNGAYKITKNAIIELYTKQGRNYVLVAEKIDGEWRVI